MEKTDPLFQNFWNLSQLLYSSKWWTNRIGENQFSSKDQWKITKYVPNRTLHPIFTDLNRWGWHLTPFLENSWHLLRTDMCGIRECMKKVTNGLIRERVGGGGFGLESGEFPIVWTGQTCTGLGHRFVDDTIVWAVPMFDEGENVKWRAGLSVWIWADLGAGGFKELGLLLLICCWVGERSGTVGNWVCCWHGLIMD